VKAPMCEHFRAILGVGRVRNDLSPEALARSIAVDAVVSPVRG